MTPNILVVNKHYKTPGQEGEVDVYIGRGSPLGNEFSHLPSSKASHRVASRDEAVSKHAEDLAARIANRDAAVCTELNRIFKLLETGKTVRLVCFCKPQSCHGDTIETVLRAAWAKKYGAA